LKFVYHSAGAEKQYILLEKIAGTPGMLTMESRYVCVLKVVKAGE